MRCELDLQADGSWLGNLINKTNIESSIRIDRTGMCQFFHTVIQLLEIHFKLLHF